jgi:fibronectin-binding autotransporter adhesin
VIFIFASSLSAADVYWSNASSGQYTNDSLWFGNADPGMGDSAYFTNKLSTTISWNGYNTTNANAYFDQPQSGGTGTYTLTMTNGIWWLTNSFVVADALGSTSTVTLTQGTVLVTNSAGTGSLTVGLNGKGTFTLSGGTVIADHLYATNFSTVEPSSLLTLNSGTITTYGDSSYYSSNNTPLGNTAGTTFRWDMLGGTNLFNFGNGEVRIAAVADSTGIVRVIGAGTLWTNTLDINVGQGGSGSSLIITNGGKVVSASGTSEIGASVSASNNFILVANTNSTLIVSALRVGNAGFGNQLIVSNSGQVTVTASSFYLSSGAATNSTVIVTDAGSLIDHLGNDLRIGSSGTSGTMIVSNGAMVRTGGAVMLGNSGNANSNSLIVTGSGTIFTNTGLLSVGGSGLSNYLSVANGGIVYSGSATIGSGNASSNNIAVVAGAGSQWVIGGTMTVGDGGASHQLIISNGGFVQSGAIIVGHDGQSSNNMATVVGQGSLWRGTVVDVGDTPSASGSLASLLVRDGGTLELSSGIITGLGGSGTISNRSGVFEFTTATPTITTNTVDSIVQTNGVLSYKGVVAANINTASVARILFQGNNTFQLNNSTGILFSAYTFAPGNGTNFQHLSMVNNGTRWQASNTTFNSGGIFTLSNTTATIFGVVTNNAGTIKVVSTNGASTTATFEKALVLSGTGDGSGAIQNLNATNTVSAPITLMGASTISSASGKLTVDGAITNGGNTLTVGGAGNVTLASQISGTGGLAINGGGTVTISNSSANTFSGATTVTNSTVTLSKAGALGSTSGITLSSSGTLLLAGGAIDRISNTAGMTMAGGTITLNDLSETMGTMTLVENSAITLNFNGAAGDLTFGNGIYTSGTLTINGWFQANEGGEDKLYFTNDPGSTFLSNITFTGYAAGARRLSSGEIVPTSVPEPGTMVAAVLLSMLGVRRWVKSRDRP